MLFIVGAYLRKYSPKIKKTILFAIYFTASALLLLFKYYFNDTSKLLNKLVYNSTIYNQPLSLIAAITLLLIFIGNGKFPHKVISYVSSCTFGIYLFHEAPLFRDVLYNQIFKTSEYWGLSHSVVYVLLFAIATFAMGLLIESIRLFLFKVITKLVHSFIPKKTDSK